MSVYSLIQQARFIAALSGAQRGARVIIIHPDGREDRAHAPCGEPAASDPFTVADAWMDKEDGPVTLSLIRNGGRVSGVTLDRVRALVTF